MNSQPPSKGASAMHCVMSPAACGDLGTPSSFPHQYRQLNLVLHVAEKSKGS